MVDNKNEQLGLLARTPKFRFSKRTGIWAIIALIIIAIVVFAFHSNQRVVFSIQGHNYTVSDISPIAEFPVKTLKTDQNTEYMDIFQMMKAIAVAKELGISPTAAEIKTQQDDLNQAYPHFHKHPGFKQWTSLAAQQAAIENLLDTQYRDGNFQGYSFIFWYGNLLTNSPTYTPPNFGNQALIAQDKSYANQQANYYYSELTTHKLTPNQILLAIEKNSKLAFDYTAGIGQNFSSHFGVTSGVAWTDQVYYSDVVSWISSQTKPGISNIMSGQSETNPSNNTYSDTFYYFVDLNKAGFSGNTFNHHLSTLPSKFYGVAS